MALRRLRILVAQECGIPLNEAVALIRAEKVTVNDEIGRTTTLVAETDEVKLNGEKIANRVVYAYVLFYKPRGIECTLNENLQGNLLEVFKHPLRLYPVGRLDKDSEGLLLMTNDGVLYHEVAHAESAKEKEYEVEVHKPVTPDFISQMKAGVEILGKKTDPCEVFSSAENPQAFKIILKQGMNRQIRRMCYKLGFSVHKLVRTRIMHLKIDDLQPGQWRDLNAEELKVLNR